MAANLGSQVDAWGAFIPGKASITEELKKKVVEAMQKRGLQNFSIRDADMNLGGVAASMAENRQHILFEQGLGRGGTATVALRIAPRGAEDMEISWRLMEKNWASWLIATLGQTGLTIFGILWIILSLAMIPIGIGVCMIIPGIAMLGVAFGWWGVSRSKSQATTYQQFDSRVLAQTVDYCLMVSLEELGVTADELRVLQNAQMGGIGKLGTR